MGEHVSLLLSLTFSRLTLCSPGYIAGVTNPIFEAAGAWDLLCDIGTNRMVVHKDIYANHPATWNPTSNQLIIRAGTLKAESSVGSEEEVVRVSTKEGAAPQKPEVSAKQDHPDNIFIDDVRSFSMHFECFSSVPDWYCLDRSWARSHRTTRRHTSARSSLNTPRGSCSSRRGTRRRSRARPPLGTHRLHTRSGRGRSRGSAAGCTSPMMLRARENLLSTQGG